MNLRKVTFIFILTAVSIILGYDLFAEIRGGNAATISGFFWKYSKEYPFIPFLMGCVCGHLFWNQASDGK